MKRKSVVQLSHRTRNRNSRSSKGRRTRSSGIGKKVSKFMNQNVDDFLKIASPIRNPERRKLSPSNTSKIWQQIKKIEDEESIIQKDIIQIDRILTRKSRSPLKRKRNRKGARNKKTSKNRISELSKPRRVTKKVKSPNSKKRFSFSMKRGGKSNPEGRYNKGNNIYGRKQTRRKTPVKNSNFYYGQRGEQKKSPSEKIEDLLNFHESKYTQITKSQLKEFQMEMRKIERILQFVQNNYKPLTDKFNHEFGSLHRTMSKMIRGSFHDFMSSQSPSSSSLHQQHKRKRRIVRHDSSDMIENEEDLTNNYPKGDVIVSEETRRRRRRGVFAKSPKQKFRQVTSKPSNRLSIGDKLRRYSGIMNTGTEPFMVNPKINDDDDLVLHGDSNDGNDDMDEIDNNLLQRALGNTPKTTATKSAFNRLVNPKEPNLGGYDYTSENSNSGRILQKDRMSSNPFFIRRFDDKN